MKRVLAAGLIAVGVMIFSGCEGPVGPAGPQGPQGVQGPQGEPGADGQDAEFDYNVIRWSNINTNNSSILLNITSVNYDSLDVAYDVHTIMVQNSSSDFYFIPGEVYDPERQLWVDMSARFEKGADGYYDLKLVALIPGDNILVASIPYLKTVKLTCFYPH